MKISLIYIVSQIFFILNYIFLLLTYRVKNKNKILIYNTISGISESIGFLLLGALSGCFMIVLSLVRNVVFWYNDKRSNTILQNISFIIFVFSIVISSIVTYDGLYTVLPGISGFIYLYSIRQSDIRIYRILGIPVALCWILYSIFICSIIGVIGDSCIFIYIVYNLISGRKYLKNKNHF